MPRFPPVQHTTRMTSPEPTGWEKTFQDHWDEKRDTQVRTFMTYNTETAFANFCAAVKRGVDESIPLPKSSKDGITLTTIYGSYDRTDRLKSNGDENTGNTKWLEHQMTRLSHDPKMLLHRYIKQHGLEIVKTGIRITGTIHYTDGSFDVIDPTKGVVVDENSKTIKTIKPIETFYAVLLK